MKDEDYLQIEDKGNEVIIKVRVDKEELKKEIIEHTIARGNYFSIKSDVADMVRKAIDEKVIKNKVKEILNDDDVMKEITKEAVKKKIEDLLDDGY